MAGKFENQVVMITGAASGFGKLAAQRFGAEGARLALSDISKDALDTLANALRQDGCEVLTDIVDVSQEAQMQAHVDHIKTTYGALNVAINNAGMGHDLKPLHMLSVDEFDRNMAVNARGVFLGMKAQIPMMLQAGSGVILNVASAAGLVGAAHLSAYAAAKHAVVGLTRAAADETARKGIRVNALCPSFAVTPLFDEMADQVGARTGQSRENAYDQITARIPMARVAQPDEIVQAMLWMCAAENSFMTGQAVALDGGLTAV
ncbi:SDR family oxidoreductase [Shimia litoralis]|uniref:SDR family oxidoreductase n=1 Tax=Shimia litoralis TaxID=420403 RepID=A0A4U7N3X3_9RHOB|nr:SDR family oxidoreductase [Shimia litoralis]TKZ19224.1 SDR family oxidoreductase [Shimia litoralis]